MTSNIHSRFVKIYNKKNQKIRALEEFSINIPKGQYLWIISLMELEKSTFINIIAGLLKRVR